MGRCRESGRLLALALGVFVLCAVPAAGAQPASAGPDTRTARLAAAQAEKATQLKPPVAGKAEVAVRKLEEQFLTGALHWHPYFESAYAGGGFTMGVGYAKFVSSYNTIDVRGSFTPSGYLRFESEFRAPRLFNRRGVLSVVGGWREATQVGFYGTGTGTTSVDDRANYGFQQPYGSATLDFRPTRKVFLLSGAVEYSQWKQQAGEGNYPSVEEVYTPETLTGLGAKVTYLHTQAAAALDWRTSPGYSRKGGYWGVTVHDYRDADDLYGFGQADYEAIQHIPIFRDAWVLSLHGRVETTWQHDGQEIPFFMLPSVGGGSSLRGFSSWRFRDRHSVLLQAEWRILVNSFFDTAVFYDAGKATDRWSDIDFNQLKSDYGIGFRLHGPAATPLRIEFAKSNEGLALVFSAKASF